MITQLLAFMIAQLLAFTPIAFLVLIGVIEGNQSVYGGGGRYRRCAPIANRPSFTVLLPLMRISLAIAFLFDLIKRTTDSVTS